MRGIIGRVVSVLALAALLTANVGFAQSSDVTVAISVPRLSNPFFGRAVQVVQAEAAERGVEVIVLDANDSSAKQQQDLETMIIRQVDGVLMAPVDAEALVTTVNDLAEAGIPVVTVDRRVLEGNYLAHVGADNVEGARVAAQYIANHVDSGPVVQLLGTPGSSPALDRAQGFNEVMAEQSQFEVISQPANFARADAVTVMETILQANPDVAAVFTHNEEMGLGAIEVLRQQGVEPGEVTVVAFDTHPETLQALQEGWLQANVEQFPDLQFESGFEILLQKINDDVDPSRKDYFLTPVVITEENIIQSEKFGE